VVTLALVLTPVASPRALAALCALDDLEVDVVPTSRGAAAVREIGRTTGTEAGPADAGAPTGGAVPVAAADGEAAMPPPGEQAPAEPVDDLGDDWDVAELFDDDVPAEARDLAARVSRLTRVGVVLVTARLIQDGGLESGLSGQISAQRYVGGEPGEELAAGLVLAGADEVVEELLLGRRAASDVPGCVSSRQAGRNRRGRRLGKGLRRPGT
jgi:hypothetical protein